MVNEPDGEDQGSVHDDEELYRESEYSDSPDGEDEEGGPVKSFLEHLEDLRWTLIKSAVALGIGMVLCLVTSPQLVQVLTWPIQGLIDNGTLELKFLGPTAGFMVALRLAFYGGLVLSSPFILFFIAQFVVPALRRTEKKYFIGAFSIGGGLFMLGVFLCYFAFLNLSVRAFFQYNEWLNIDPQNSQIVVSTDSSGSPNAGSPGNPGSGKGELNNPGAHNPGSGSASSGNGTSGNSASESGTSGNNSSDNASSAKGSPSNGSSDSSSSGNDSSGNGSSGNDTSGSGASQASNNSDGEIANSNGKSINPGAGATSNDGSTKSSGETTKAGKGNTNGSETGGNTNSSGAGGNPKASGGPGAEETAKSGSGSGKASSSSEVSSSETGQSLSSAAQMWRAEEYFLFVARFMLAMGLSFELPVVILTLVKLRLVDHENLVKGRKYMLIFNLVLASVVTPQDLVTTILMVLPLQFLFEICIWISSYWHYREKQREAALGLG